MKPKIGDLIKYMIMFLKAIFKAIWNGLIVFVKLLLLGKFNSNKKSGDCCIKPSDDMRPRPDPYVYSQEWLQLRNIAYTWDNPDFTLLDSAGTTADRMNLKPGEKYTVVVRVHNGSLFAAINTKVALDVLEFGMGGIVTESLGSVNIDIPSFGHTNAVFLWNTPIGGGHNCLRVYLTHPDDGNPLNNIGQHNTEVAKPASPTRTSTFLLRNSAPGVRLLRLECDSYLLPNEPMRARTLQQRQSLAYLRELRSRNNREQFVVPASLNARISINGGLNKTLNSIPSTSSIELNSGEKAFIKFEGEPPAKGEKAVVVNIHAFDGQKLIGGVTIYVDPKKI
jgi:hypothetical protein